MLRNTSTLMQLKHLLKCIFVRKSLRESHFLAPSVLISKFHATSYEKICTS